MARNRTVSPKFWDHVTLSRMTPTPRLLFVGLFSMADDPGNILAEPFYLWQTFFAGDPSTSLEAVASARDALVAANVVELYEDDGVQYIHHPNFEDHQTMNRKYKPLYPLAPGQDYSRTVVAHKLSPKTAAEAADEPRQTRMKMSPPKGDLAAYALLDACYEAIVGHVELPLSKDAWKKRNKRGAQDLVAAGKTPEECAAMLKVAHTHPMAKRYYAATRLDKLAEWWPAIVRATSGTVNGAGRPTFERLLPPIEQTDEPTS
jgi:hypothetical protein